MSDFPADYADRFNLCEQIARIDRNQVEIQKLFAESGKLTVEAAKVRRERLLAPILAAGALGGFIAAVLPLILRSWGVH